MDWPYPGAVLGTALGVILIQLLKNGLALTGVKGDATIRWAAAKARLTAGRQKLSLSGTV